MKAIQRARKTGRVKTNAIVYVTEGTKCYKALTTKHQNKYKFENLMHMPRILLTVSNNLLYDSNGLYIPQGKFSLKLFHNLHEPPKGGICDLKNAS